MSSFPLQENIIQPLALSPLQLGLKSPNEKIAVSIAESVSRSPIVPPAQLDGIMSVAKSGRKRRQAWSKQEDALLADTLMKYRHDRPNWPQIAQELNKNLDSSRSGKQCRERWRNHLRPNIKKGAWTIEEERMIRNMYHTFGPKWSCMAKLLTDRTDNDIKNKWYSMYRSGKVQFDRANGSSNAHQIPPTTWRQGISPTSSILQNADVPEFPPPFSLTPIVPGSRSNCLDTSATFESDGFQPKGGEGMESYRSFGDVTF